LVSPPGGGLTNGRCKKRRRKRGWREEIAVHGVNEKKRIATGYEEGRRAKTRCLERGNEIGLNPTV